jgi:hypothetical protein
MTKVGNIFGAFDVYDLLCGSCLSCGKAFLEEVRVEIWRRVCGES